MRLGTHVYVFYTYFLVNPTHETRDAVVADRFSPKGCHSLIVFATFFYYTYYIFLHNKPR